MDKRTISSNGGTHKSSGGTTTEQSASDAALQILVSVVQVGITCVGSYYISRWLSKSLQGQNSRPYNNEARARLEKMLLDRADAEQDGQEDNEAVKRRYRRKVSSLELNSYEAAIAEDVIDPADISTSFRDVGGIDDIKAELFDLVVLPILRPDLFRSSSGLVTPPRGILLCTLCYSIICSCHHLIDI